MAGCRSGIAKAPCPSLRTANSTNGLCYSLEGCFARTSNALNVKAPLLGLFYGLWYDRDIQGNLRLKDLSDER
jgi:hypothetical protein